MLATLDCPSPILLASSFMREYLVQYTFTGIRSDEFPDELLDKLADYEVDPVVDGAVDQPGLLHLSISVQADTLVNAHERGLEVTRTVTDHKSPISVDQCVGMVVFEADKADVLSQAKVY